MPLSQRRPALFLFSLPPSTPTRDASQSRTSTDSAKSSDKDAEWTRQQIAILSTTLDNIPTTLTPYNGSIPPNNLLDKIAKSVKKSRGAEWPHSTRATRQMLINLAEQKASKENNPRTPVNNAMNQCEPIRKPLYKKNSMDFIPPPISSNVNITRAATRLRRSERFFTVHPYARLRQLPSPPSSDKESSVSPARTRPLLERSLSTCNPVPKVKIPITTLTPPAPGPLASAHALAKALNMDENSTLPVIAHRTSNPCIARIKPQESATRPTSMGPTVFSDYHPPAVDAFKQPHLKRLPSYNVINPKSNDQSPMDLCEPEIKVATNGESSDEEEKHRQKTVKRVKTLHRKPSYMGAELPLRPAPVSDSLESLLRPEPSLCSTVSMASMRSNASSNVSMAPSDRTPSKPSKAPQLATPASPSPKPRTLRRVATKRLRSPEAGVSSPERAPRPLLKPLMNLGRKISFGGPDSPAPASGKPAPSSLASMLSSPFEEKKIRLAPPAEIKSRRGSKYLF